MIAKETQQLRMIKTDGPFLKVGKSLYFVEANVMWGLFSSVFPEWRELSNFVFAECLGLTLFPFLQVSWSGIHGSGISCWVAVVSQDQLQLKSRRRGNCLEDYVQHIIRWRFNLRAQTIIRSLISYRMSILIVYFISSKWNGTGVSLPSFKMS